jgi:hypothetical protein
MDDLMRSEVALQCLGQILVAADGVEVGEVVGK